MHIAANEGDDSLYDVAEEYVVDWYPAQEAVESFEGAAAQGRGHFVRVAQDGGAELEDLRELLVHVLLELGGLLHSQLILTEVEYLLRQHLQYAQVVLAQHQVALASGADVRDKGLPGGTPLVLHDLHQDRVGLREDALHALVQVADGPQLQHQPHYVRFDTVPLGGRQRQPSLLNYYSATLMALSMSTSVRNLV